MPQSTFVCPSVVDAPPCSPTVLSCGWRSVDVGAAVSVQRSAAVSGVESVSRYCSCLDVCRSSLPRSTSVCPLVVDGRSRVPSPCTPDDSCTLACRLAVVAPTRAHWSQRHVDATLTRSRSMWNCRAVEDAVPQAVDGPSRRLRTAVTVYHVHGRCDSVYC